MLGRRPARVQFPRRTNFERQMDDADGGVYISENEEEEEVRCHFLVSLLFFARLLLSSRATHRLEWPRPRRDTQKELTSPVLSLERAIPCLCCIVALTQPLGQTDPRSRRPLADGGLVGGRRPEIDLATSQASAVSRPPAARLPSAVYRGAQPDGRRA